MQIMFSLKIPPKTIHSFEGQEQTQGYWMSQAIDYRLQKNPIVHHIANIYSSSIICAKRESVIKCIFTLCAVNVHLSESCALGILLHWEYLGNPFTVLPPLALSMDRQPCGKRHRLCQCQKKRKSPKTLHLQVTVELTELKSTLGDVQSSLTSSLASIQGDINPDVLMFYVFSRSIKVMCRCWMFEVLGHKKQYRRW